MAYVATTNVPGYSPMDDAPPVFDTAQEAWDWLAEQRERDEDNADYPENDPGQFEYTDTLATLRYIASPDHTHGALTEDWPTNRDGTGTVYGATPGRSDDDPHDLGLAYCVIFDPTAVVNVD